MAAVFLAVLRTPSTVRVPNAGAVRERASAAAEGTWLSRIATWSTRLSVPARAAAAPALVVCLDASSSADACPARRAGVSCRPVSDLVLNRSPSGSFTRSSARSWENFLTRFCSAPARASSRPSLLSLGPFVTWLQRMRRGDGPELIAGTTDSTPSRRSQPELADRYGPRLGRTAETGRTRPRRPVGEVAGLPLSPPSLALGARVALTLRLLGGPALIAKLLNQSLRAPGFCIVVTTGGVGRGPRVPR